METRATDSRPAVRRTRGSHIVIGVLGFACAALVIMFQVQGYLVKRQGQQLQEKRRLVTAWRQDRGAPELAGAARDQTAALQTSQETPEIAAKNARAEICDFAIREVLRDLEPFSGSPLEIALADGTWNVRRRVKSADTQLPGAVREVDCRIDASGDVHAISRVPG